MQILINIPEELVIVSQQLVKRFAEAMAAKLVRNQEKYGWTNEWAVRDWMDQCRESMVEHLAKGDPLDVAILSAFLWFHGEPCAADPRVEKLQAFKTFVHRRLDEMGIPSHPDGEHSKAGCRIGDRLDLVEQALKKGVQQWAEPSGERCPKCDRRIHPVLGAKCMSEECPGKAERPA